MENLIAYETRQETARLSSIVTPVAPSVDTDTAHIVIPVVAPPPNYSRCRPICSFGNNERHYVETCYKFRLRAKASELGTWEASCSVMTTS